MSENADSTCRAIVHYLGKKLDLPGMREVDSYEKLK